MKSCCLTHDIPAGDNVYGAVRPMRVFSTWGISVIRKVDDQLRAAIFEVAMISIYKNIFDNLIPEMDVSGRDSFRKIIEKSQNF